MASIIKGPRLFTSAFCTNCRRRLLPSTPIPPLRSFGTTPSANAVYNTIGDNSSTISDILNAPPESLINQNFLDAFDTSRQMDEAHKLHVYATKHNTHITFVQPRRPASQTASSGISRTSASAADQKKQVDVLLSLSTGNIGFRKAGRGSYDAAYQLAAFVLKQIQEKGMIRDIQKLDVVLRGFGSGREAVSKALLGTEGRFLRTKITSVVDATRLKQGGPRSKKPRRLG